MECSVTSYNSDPTHMNPFNSPQQKIYLNERQIESQPYSLYIAMGPCPHHPKFSIALYGLKYEPL